MLTDVFAAVLAMSGLAMVAAFGMMLVSLPLRYIRRFPRWLCAALWSVVLLRMVCPVSLTTPWSLTDMAFPRHLAQLYSLGASVAGGEDTYMGEWSVAVEGMPEYERAVAAGVEPSYQEDFDWPAVFYREVDGEILPAMTAREGAYPIMAKIWLAGVCAFLLYGAASYGYFKRKVATATRVSPGVFETDRISSPFVLGYFRPKIYLPLGLEADQRDLIVRHERAHIARGDHWTRLSGYLAMCLHWWNFMLWGVYRVFLEDQESACDARVLRSLDREGQLDYGQVLLNFSTNRRFFGAAPLAFGEVSTKERV